MYTRWIAAPVVLSIFLSVFSCGGGLAHALNTTTAVAPGGAVPQSAPAVASNGTTLLAAWAETGGVYATRIDATTGAILDTNPTRLATSNASTIDIASLGSGFLVVWSAGTGIFAATVTDAGVATSVTVNAFGSEPAVAAAASNYLVTWVNAGQVEATVLDANAGSLTNGGFVVSADGAHPTAASNGSAFLLSWMSMSTAQLRAQRFSTSGQPIDAAPIVVSSTPIAAARPSATYTSSGYFLAWGSAPPAAGTTPTRTAELVVPGLGNKLIAFGTRLTPRWLVRKIAARLPESV